MTRRRWLVLGAAAVALAVIAGGVALAKTASSEAAREKAKRDYAKLFDQRLAAHLGIDAAALDAARKGAIEDVIAQALKDGTITAEQAATWREKLAGGVWPGFAFGHKFGFRQHPGEKHAALEAIGDTVAGALAKGLGMGVEDMRAAFRSGTTLEELAKVHGTAVAALGKSAAAAAKPVLDKLATAGTIRRELADALLKKLEAGHVFLFGPKMRHRAA